MSGAAPPCAIGTAATYSYPVCTSANGSITMAPTGGTAPYTYHWSNGSTAGSLTNLAIGTYMVTVTDANKCTATRTFTMTAYMRVMNLSTTVAGDTCNAGIGKATVTVVSNGVSPYSYQWTSGGTAATASGLPVGSYTVTVTDANGCRANAAATVTNLGTQIQQNATLSQPLCPSAGGTIAINPTGGTASIYSVLWNNGASSNTINNLPAGTYTATVSGKNGCKATASYTVNAPPASINMNATSAAPLCNGGRGSITINPSGGTGPAYAAHWSNGETGMTDTSLLAGNYTVTVTDQNNCTASQILTVNPGPVINPAANITSPICTAANGVIQMSPSNGRAPYLFLWSTGDTTTVRNNLAVGSYQVTVTDANGCNVVQSFTLSAYMRPLTLTTATVADTCASGKGKASVSVTSSASTAPFVYNWGNGQMTTTIIGLTPAAYPVSVTDANGCSATTTATVINRISSLIINNTSTSPVCRQTNLDTC